MEEDQELGNLIKEEDKKINGEYKDITNPKEYNQEQKQQLRNNIAGNIAGIGTEVTGAYATDLVTAKIFLNPATIAATGGWSILGYGAANFVSGGATNWAAQKLRGEEEISWGEIVSSGLIDIIPFFGQKVKGVKGVTNVALQSGARTVAQRQGEVALDDQRWLTPRETLEAAALGGAFGAGFKGTGEGINLLKGKYRKYDIEEARELFPPEVIQRLIEQNRIHKVPKFARYYAMQKGIDNINGEDHFWAPLKRLQNSKNPKDQAKYTEIKEFLEGKGSKGAGGYYKREEANEELMAIADKAFAAGQKVEGYRTVAGFLPLKDRTYPSGNKELGLISIAKKHGYTIEDVHKYIVDQEEGNKYLHILIKELNKFNSNKKVKILDELTQLKSRMGEAGFRTSQPWYQTYLKLRKYAKLNKYEFGHKESLWKMWINELSGGNRVSNTYAQSRGNWKYTDFYGKQHSVKGNRSLGSKDDLPTFTLIKLQGSSANLEDDFVKYMMPMRANTSISDEYMEMADILYRKSMDEVKLNLNRNLPSEEYYAEVGKHSMAVTQALHVLFKKADDIELPYWILEDDLLLKIPAKQIWEGLNPTDKAAQVSLKNLKNKFKQLRSLYTSTLDTILENL